MSHAAGKFSLCGTGAMLLAAATSCLPSLARAHAFGSRYELPVPVWLFILGGAATVTMTFVLVNLFVKKEPVSYAQAQCDLSRFSFLRRLVYPWSVRVLKGAAVGLLILIVFAGFVGIQDPNRNITPTLVWVIWWVGFSYFTMLIGNIWPTINPWKTIFERVFPNRAIRPETLSQTRPYPEWLQAWPAVAFLIGFAWIEQIFPYGAHPHTMSLMIIAYCAVTWTGMYVYGTEIWLRQCDPFHIVFDLYGRFAPVASWGPGWKEPGQRKIILRPYAARLLQHDEHLMSFSMAAFVLAMLSSVLFDGLLGSAYWIQFENFIHGLNPKLSDTAWIAVHTFSLVAIWGGFCGLYIGTCRIMSGLTDRQLSTITLARAFSLTLIPIVIGYHFAHTFSYLLVQGQSIFSLVSDPFGKGWDLFGSAGYQVNFAVMKTKTAWYLAVTAIVAGHVVSIYLAHVLAERLLKDRVAAIRILAPMSLLMVVYTIFSLTILAEPLVKYSGVNEEIVWLDNNPIVISDSR